MSDYRWLRACQALELLAIHQRPASGRGRHVTDVASRNGIAGRRVAEAAPLIAACPPSGHADRVTLAGMTAEQLALITTDPQVMSGQAVLAGTRVPVSVILDCLAAGMTSQQILAEYPTISEAGIRAAAAYGALLAREELVPLPPLR